MEGNMGWPNLMVFVRHGESVKNAIGNGNQNLTKGKLPTHLVPLTPRGEQQAKIVREYLDSRYGKFDASLTSYYLRAKETLRIMYPNEKCFEMPMLAEVQQGIWDTISTEEIAKLYPHEVVRKETEGWYHYRPPGGENFLDVESRVINFIVFVQIYFAQKNVLVISHGNWFCIFQKVIHHLTIEQSLPIFRRGYENCSVTSYSVEINGKQASFKLLEDNFVPWKGKL